MKKLFTLIFATALASSMFAQTSHSYEVADKSQFNEAMDAIAALPAGDAAYVYISGYVDVGTLKTNVSDEKNGKMLPTLRNIHFVGIDGEDGKATLSMEMQIPADNTETSGFSLHYENLKLRQTQGVWGNSKHLMNFKDAKKHYIDTLEFVNCELTELCRSLFRGEVNGAGDEYTGAGTLKVFRMENCVMHNGFRQATAMPIIYMAQPVNEMVIKNNTLYDLTYPNGLISFGQVSENAGRQAIKVTIENNTICCFSRSSLLNFGDGVSTESEFHIKNNIILQPNWADDMNCRFGDSNSVHDNMGTINDKITDVDADGNVTETDPTNGILTEEEIQARIDKGIVLTGINGGYVQLENNMLYGYKYQNMADAVDTGDITPITDNDDEGELQEGEFSSLAMEDVPFAWTDFADVQNDFFQINFSNPAYTAGKNGAPLGDTNNYTDQVIKVVTVNVNIEGSKSAKVTIAPEKAAYMAGDEITLTADCNGSLNTFKGWSNGMTDEVITLTLEDDLDITATFEEMDYIAVWNLDDITANNVVKTPPVDASYGSGLTLDYARYIIPEGEETGEYKMGTGIAEMTDGYDGAKRAIQTRNNKVSGDVRNCFLITTPNTQFTAGEDGKPDYLFFNVNEAIEASKLQFYVASDNIPYNTYAISYTTDGENWTEVSTFSMEGKTQTNEWYPIEANLPALTAGAKVRIMGVAGSGMAMSDEMRENVENEIAEVGTEFLFVAEIILAPGNGQVVVKGDVNGDGSVDVADISAIISVMAGTASYSVADVNVDGSVDVADILSVISIMAGN